MYILNLGIHNFHNNNVHGSQDVASCILKNLKNLSERHIIACSDMCAGQNRNIKVALPWLKIVETVEHNRNNKMVKTCWMHFLRDEPYKIFYKISMAENAKFNILDLLPLYKNIR
ncbi:hypothetical protein J437_LFUL010526 [Ladona fulva]|uniref:Uncharacterized protein n=1 Tax=Ladona fulva TaxID=123851 RepID=A0A8K0KQ81_LADFU|nr:hypothetical protein J437_LFUL010526 [Ladona fulva]